MNVLKCGVCDGMHFSTHPVLSNDERENTFPLGEEMRVKNNLENKY